MLFNDIKIRVETFLEDLEFTIRSNAKGSMLFELVMNKMGLKEDGKYFGLQYTDDKGWDKTWLKMKSKILNQHVVQKDNQQPLIFKLRIKLYQVDLESIQDGVILKLLYLQVLHNLPIIYI